MTPSQATADDRQDRQNVTVTRTDKELPCTTIVRRRGRRWIRQQDTGLWHELTDGGTSTDGITWDQVTADEYVTVEVHGLHGSPGYLSGHRERRQTRR